VNKNTSEDKATTVKNPIPNHDTNTKAQAPSPTPLDANQSSEGAQPALSASPTVSQHQAVYLPFLHVMYTQVPNMTNQPRMPQGISMESDGSDLPEGALMFSVQQTALVSFELSWVDYLNKVWAGFTKAMAELEIKLINPTVLASTTANEKGLYLRLSEKPTSN